MNPKRNGCAMGRGGGNRGRLLTAILLVAGLLGSGARAALYTETYETPPGGTGYAALLGSPYGVTYDFYPGRAFKRLAGLAVLGKGDEAFYWGNNAIFPQPDPIAGEPGTSYCDDMKDSNYLLNGYGTGYKDWVLGFEFSALTNVVSLDLGYASGSNAPTHEVEVQGFVGADPVWNLVWTVPAVPAVPADVAYGALTTIIIPQGNVAVDRVEIWRADAENPYAHGLPLGWYTLDNLKFDATGAPGDYTWQYYTEEDYRLTFVPEPATFLLLGMGGLALLRRNRGGG
ncbi:MAG: PEP-CTERM sorting domain-containing protein [Verrucomicrobia bacterium]|nr:PEP-CTERM sorting domain-containing protein [Verrucomicrobiota bacterium]